MGVKQPTEMPKTWERHFNERNKSAIMALYDDQAVLTMDGNVQVKGKADIEATLSAMMTQPNKAVCRCVSCWQAGDTALVRTEWHSTDPTGAVVMKGLAAEVLRRGSDGLWRFVIDDATYASRR